MKPHVVSQSVLQGNIVSVSNENVEKETLWDQFKHIFSPNASPIIRESIRELETLPDLKLRNPLPKNWSPKFEDMLYIRRLVAWGIPLVMTKEFADEASNLKPLRQRIGGAIARNGFPDPNDLAELDCAALMILNQAKMLKRIQKTSFPTPDYHVYWDNTVIEVEVTKAQPKETRIETEKSTKSLMERLVALELKWHIVIYFANRLTEEDIQLLLQTLREAKLGHYRLLDRWWLFIENLPPPVPEAELRMQIDDTVGAWPVSGWLSDIVQTGFESGFRTYSPEEGKLAVNIIDINAGVPRKNYINPLERKATRVQGSKAAPFIVAIDIGELPGGFAVYQQILPTYLEKHPDISAVLLFERTSEGKGFLQIHNGFEWTWKLHLNSNADHPLPSAMLDAFPLEGNRRWPYSLTESKNTLILGSRPI
jgi:hypothetical protein